MSRPAAGISRPGTADSTASATSPPQGYDNHNSFSNSFQDNRNNSTTSLSSANDGDNGPQYRSANVSASGTNPPSAQNSSGTTSLSGLVCNVHKCTGTPPHALVGATTTILGDKLYVFGGRRLSRRRPTLTADLYQLDLLRRHWTKIEASGDIPPPRYFHSVCALGDNKLICYGGMSPASSASGPLQTADQQPEVVVMSDIHIYDTNTRAWTHVPILENPQGRYAHCATVLPSSGVFSSANAPLSAIHHNPSSGNPNQGSIGVALDGTGGAEMLVVGGQDSENTYIDQISVFNLRSLKWTGTTSFSRSCGAYRSVVAPLTGISVDKVGAGINKESRESFKKHNGGSYGPSSMLVYSNYNFLDVKLDLQLRLPDGSLVEKPMNGQFSPPGLRFPNGGVLDNHFVVSGTYLTSSRQEYALWALDLRTLGWTRIDAGGSVFTSGSWNRGVLWPRRNTFVILGDRRRNLVEDYNHRRINFTNICLVELEAFGLYDNPRHTSPTSSYLSSSAAILPPNLIPRASTWTGGGRPHFGAAEELGQMAMNMKEIADMEILAISGERIPVNSHLISRRWGPYFVHLMREGANAPLADGGDGGGGETATLKAASQSVASRNSSITITPSVTTQYTTSTLTSGRANPSADRSTFNAPSPDNLAAHKRSRTLYLPHTPLTIQALLHYLYTSALPPVHHTLSTPQILCSLLQLARPYRIDGLLEAVVERLHEVMDGRNAAAVFNASAMAAGGGRGTGFDSLGGVKLGDELSVSEHAAGNGVAAAAPRGRAPSSRAGASNGVASRQQPSTSSGVTASDSEDDRSSGEGSISGAAPGGNGVGRAQGAGVARTRGGVRPDDEDEVWSAERSCVIGLQKRGLRGLMEGRRMRERGRSVATGAPPGQGHGTEVAA